MLSQAVISTHYHTEPEEMAESMEKFNEVRQVNGRKNLVFRREGNGESE